MTPGQAPAAPGWPKATRRLPLRDNASGAIFTGFFLKLTATSQVPVVPGERHRVLRRGYRPTRTAAARSGHRPASAGPRSTRSRHLRGCVAEAVKAGQIEDVADEVLTAVSGDRLPRARAEHRAVP